METTRVYRDSIGYIGFRVGVLGVLFGCLKAVSMIQQVDVRNV